MYRNLFCIFWQIPIVRVWYKPNIDSLLQILFCPFSPDFRIVFIIMYLKYSVNRCNNVKLPASKMDVDCLAQTAFKTKSFVCSLFRHSFVHHQQTLTLRFLCLLKMIHLNEFNLLQNTVFRINSPKVKMSQWIFYFPTTSSVNTKTSDFFRKKQQQSKSNNILKKKSLNRAEWKKKTKSELQFWFLFCSSSLVRLSYEWRVFGWNFS